MCKTSPLRLPHKGVPQGSILGTLCLRLEIFFPHLLPLSDVFIEIDGGLLDLYLVLSFGKSVGEVLKI